MEPSELIDILFLQIKGCYSLELGIDLANLDKKELYKWLIASKLYGSRVAENIAKATYQSLEKKGMLELPNGSSSLDEDMLVMILAASGYGKNDHKTAAELIELSKVVWERYHGDLNELHAQAKDNDDLETQLNNLPGIGPISSKVFLRELRGLWPKSNPLAAHSTACSARRLGLTRILAKNDKDLKEVIETLKSYWSNLPGKEQQFSDFEVALLRQGKNFCLKGKCLKCQLASYCRYYAETH